MNQKLVEGMELLSASNVTTHRGVGKGHGLSICSRVFFPCCLSGFGICGKSSLGVRPVRQTRLRSSLIPQNLEEMNVLTMVDSHFYAIISFGRTFCVWTILQRLWIRARNAEESSLLSDLSLLTQILLSRISQEEQTKRYKKRNSPTATDDT